MNDVAGKIERASHEVDLGLPVARGRRFSIFQKIVAKITWPLLRHQVRFNREVLAVLESLGEIQTHLSRIDGDLTHHTSVLVRHEEPLERHEFILGTIASDLERRIQFMNDKVDLAQRQAFSRYHEGVGALRIEVADLLQRIDAESKQVHEYVEAIASDVREDTSRFHDNAIEATSQFQDAIRNETDAIRNETDAIRNETFAIGAKLESTAVDFRYRMAAVDLFLDEVRRSYPDPPPPDRLAVLPDALSAIYSSFEEVFRGSAADIRERVSIYLADIKSIPDGGPVVDIGCGRGEWLEVLHDAKIEAYGVDLNESAAQLGKEKGLEIVIGDIRDHLASLPEASIGAVTAFHVVEHLDTGLLLEVLDLARRAIRPGGLVILETPNPENLGVGACSFYLDPTHKAPIPPPLLSYLVGTRGFSDAEIRPLKRLMPLRQPKPDQAGVNPWESEIDELWDVLSTRVFGAEDYAVIARRL